jgi:16S rRNA processing protein RimM
MQPRHVRIEKSSSKSSRNSPLSDDVAAGAATPTFSSSGDGDARDGMIRVATVARALGLAGELILEIHPSIREVVSPGLTVRLSGRAGEIDAQITDVRTQGRRLVVRFEGICDRTAAERWTGAAAFATRHQLGPCSDGQYFDFELLGASVVDEDGSLIGEIKDIVSNPANDVFIATGPSGEFLIPVTAHAVLSIDTRERRVTVDPRALVYDDDRRER